MLVAPLVIDLGVLLTFLVALALCLLAKRFVEALFQVASGALGWIPWLGSRLTGPLHVIEQRLTNKLGSVAEGLSARIGSLWHSAARLVQETGQKIEDAYRLIGGVAGILELFVPWREVLALYHELQKAIARIHGTSKAQTQAVAHAGRVANDARKRADTAQARAQAIPADVVIPGDLSGLRGRVREAEDEIGRLWDRVRGLSRPAIGGLALGALTFALGRLGIGWARCSNVGKVGRSLCGMNPDLLESLLAGAVVVASPISVVELAKAAQKFTSEAEDGLRWFVRELQ